MLTWEAGFAAAAGGSSWILLSPRCQIEPAQLPLLLMNPPSWDPAGWDGDVGAPAPLATFLGAAEDVVCRVCGELC